MYGQLVEPIEQTCMPGILDYLLNLEHAPDMLHGVTELCFGNELPAALAERLSQTALLAQYQTGHAAPLDLAAVWHQDLCLLDCCVGHCAAGPDWDQSPEDKDGRTAQGLPQGDNQSGGANHMLQPYLMYSLTFAVKPTDHSSPHICRGFWQRSCWRHEQKTKII
jgi:hypothetical protein